MTAAPADLAAATATDHVLRLAWALDAGCAGCDCAGRVQVEGFDPLTCPCICHQRQRRENAAASGWAQVMANTSHNMQVAWDRLSREQHKRLKQLVDLLLAGQPINTADLRPHEAMAFADGVLPIYRMAGWKPPLARDTPTLPTDPLLVKVADLMRRARTTMGADCVEMEQIADWLTELHHLRAGDRLCVCNHWRSQHVVRDGVLTCTFLGCACGPGCIHDGFVDVYAAPDAAPYSLRVIVVREADKFLADNGDGCSAIGATPALALQQLGAFMQHGSRLKYAATVAGDGDGVVALIGQHLLGPERDTNIGGVGDTAADALRNLADHLDGGAGVQVDLPQLQVEVAPDANHGHVAWLQVGDTSMRHEAAGVGATPALAVFALGDTLLDKLHTIVHRSDMHGDCPRCSGQLAGRVSIAQQTTVPVDADSVVAHLIAGLLQARSGVSDPDLVDGLRTMASAASARALLGDGAGHAPQHTLVLLQLAQAADMMAGNLECRARVQRQRSLDTTHAYAYRYLGAYLARLEGAAWDALRALHGTPWDQLQQALDKAREHALVVPA